MKSAVWGSGAIGGVVGAGMGAAGEDVLLLDIVSEHVDAMNDTGLLIKSGAGGHRVAVRAATPDQVTGTFDLICPAVQWQYTTVSRDAMEPLLRTESTVVSL